MVHGIDTRRPEVRIPQSRNPERLEMVMCPISCDLEARRKYTLTSDLQLPAETRPTFFFRYLTRRQKLRYLEFGEAIRKGAAQPPVAQPPSAGEENGQTQPGAAMPQDTVAQDEHQEGQNVITDLYAKLGQVLAGWRNLVYPPGAGPDLAGKPVPYDPARLDVLDDVLLDAELWQLYWAGASEIDEDDRKNSASPPSSPAAKSARAGDAPSAN
jgi:hypothetical protein